MFVRWLLMAGLAALAAPTGAAQTVAELIANGRQLADRDPAGALVLFERALQLEPTSGEAHWRAAEAAVAIGEEVDGAHRAERDSLFRVAEGYARRAVAIDSTTAESQFALAMALGRTALTKGKRERIKFAAEIYQAANRALALDPNHDGAHHILGLWHAETLRISGFSRFLARKLLGGKILGQASWDQAISHLEAAVRLDPNRLTHRLDLARVYLERKRPAQAREQLIAVGGLPDRFAGDARLHAEAAELLARIGPP